MKRLAALALFGALLCGCPPSSAQSIHDAGAADAKAEGGASDASAGADAAPWEEGNVPPAQSEELTARMRHLLEAIAQDNPDLAKDVLYPRDAWIQVKDAPDPAKTWDTKLASAFKKSVHRTHKRRKHMDRAKFVGFELGKQVNLVSPKKKDLKKPAWRVKRSKVLFTIDDKSASFEIAEMTAYRGAWYVTRLR
jgi:hypothetical protein